MSIDRRRFLAALGGVTGTASVLPGHTLWTAVAASSSWAGPDGHPRWALTPGFVERLPALLADAGVLGVSIAVAPRGVEGSTGPGSGAVATAGRQSPNGGPVETDTLFPAGSLSKPLVATIALSLHRAGTFDIGRPLAAYIESDLPEGDGAGAITARHALEHTTGLPNWRFTSDTPLATTHRPGIAWGYSGEGVILVQRAMEAVTGIGLEALARTHVFEPLGMRSSSFLGSPDRAARLAEPHAPGDRFIEYMLLAQWKSRALVEWAEGRGADPARVTIDDAREADTEISALAARMAGREFPATDPVPNFLGPNGAGGLTTTAADYLRLVRHWLADDELRGLAFADPVPRSGGLRWGLGWGMEGAGQAFWHWGEAPGLRALAYGSPDLDGGGGLVVLTTGDRGLEIAEAAFVDATGTRSEIFDAI
ncbi:MAG: serine hydrolase domain-containing protein [Gemmatimonadota bacterium]|nr:serine hydrolase domain-containing protein [Gemmatimonadota bacterium]